MASTIFIKTLSIDFNGLGVKTLTLSVKIEPPDFQRYTITVDNQSHYLDNDKELVEKIDRLQADFIRHWERRAADYAAKAAFLRSLGFEGEER
jgi:hypothetical protein